MRQVRFVDDTCPANDGSADESGDDEGSTSKQKKSPNGGHCSENQQYTKNELLQIDLVYIEANSNNEMMDGANTEQKYVDESDMTYDQAITYCPVSKSYPIAAEDAAVSHHVNENGPDRQNHGEKQERSYPLRELTKTYFWSPDAKAKSAVSAPSGDPSFVFEAL